MLNKRLLGSTGIEVSEIGLGTVKIGRNAQVKYPHSFAIPDDKAVVQLLEKARDLGINLIDTAPAYGQSEERLGKLLPAKRMDWIIVSKAGEEFINGQSYFDFSPAHIEKSVKRSLTRLNTDYLDMVLIHSDGRDQEIIERYQVFDTLQRLKEQGWIRAYGMSIKTVFGGQLTIDNADVVMATYNTESTDEKSVLDYAYAKQKGVLIKKALASGHIASPNKVNEALDFVLKEKSVSSVIIGTINPSHLEANVWR